MCRIVALSARSTHSAPSSEVTREQDSSATASMARGSYDLCAVPLAFLACRRCNDHWSANTFNKRAAADDSSSG